MHNKLSVSCLTLATSSGHDDVYIRLSCSADETLGAVQNVAVPILYCTGLQTGSIATMTGLCETVGGEQLEEEGGGEGRGRRREEEEEEGEGEG